MTTAFANERLQSEVNRWRARLAGSDDEHMLETFHKAVAGVAKLLAKGLDVGNATETLLELARAYGLFGALGEAEPEIERIIHDEFEKVPRKPNGKGHTDPDEWDAGDEPGPIPPRQWLLGNHFCLGFVSSIVAAGGGGKTSLRILQFVSMALGRSLCGQHVFRRCRVLLVSLEDDRNEIQRRITAVLKHFKIDRRELKGWLTVWTPTHRVKLAEMGRNRTRKIGDLPGQLREKIIRLKPDIVSLDPFIKTHSLNENDNSEMDWVCSMLTEMSIEFQIGVDSPHHVKKGSLLPGDADSGRGASGIRDAARLVYTLCQMTIAEARQFDIPEAQRRFYIRLDSAKVNTAPPAIRAEWFHLVSVALGNPTPDYPSGDHCQVAEPWQAPNWEISVREQNRILDVIAGGMPNGQRYSNAPAAKDRQAWKVVEHFTNLPEAACRKWIFDWMKAGALMKVDYQDKVERKKRSGLNVVNEKRPKQEDETSSTYQSSSRYSDQDDDLAL